ncbi:choice-of-anchor M domain-containing protein [Actinoplanes sp. TRM 88003]|uniref:Choice-of-anchor M domain-containing protein n=1 Tax=Paractinoplanes aksuensis TaxID=2939490 RepID=A0ABT1E6A2_9ACTN|nr:choice-of-anchor M domain-containing protein [Actinoplanes aksuensis]MCO8277791.1 choice-of-anchor M domain-containing protein [Actinoplanes aksuensis]
MRKPLRLLLGSGILAAALVGTTVPAQAHTVPAAPVVLSAGHVDVVDVAYEDGELGIGVHDETVEPDVERAVDDVVLLVKRAAKTIVPAAPAFGFLGSPGAPVWILPEIQNENLLWPGLAAEEIEAGVFAGDTVTVKVEKVIGPGRFAVFTEDAVGTPQILVNSGDGLPDALTLAAGTHQHASWAFQKAGVYLIKVRATAKLAGTGTTVTSEPVVYKFVVQP